jgi:SPP1 family predicted phage head-tail adaptor
MQAGKLRNYVTIQTYTNTQNAYGETAKSWATYASVWCEIRNPYGKEIEQAGQQKATLTHVLVWRHLAGVTPDMRVLFGTRVFQIVSVNPDPTSAIFDTVNVLEEAAHA